MKPGFYVFLGLILWVVSPDSASGEVSAPPYTHEEILFDKTWSEAVAAAVAVSDVDALDGWSLNDLEAAHRRLERASVQLIELRPPPEQLDFHLTALPALQEVTAAMRAVADARRAGAAAEVSAAKQWLLDAEVELSATMKHAAGLR